MYPLQFEKLLLKKIWGGQAFRDVLGFNLPNNSAYGESWEVCAHEMLTSVVKNGEYRGKTLQELLEEHKEKLVGTNVYKKFGNKFPLLFKFLDINDKLSVQVHPDNEYAIKNEGQFGKGECWYILEASPDAKLVLGVNKKINKELFTEKVKNNDFNELFNVVSVKKGDLINIKPGLVHASLEGSILIYEPQQNSDVTYRIYDFDRIVEGKKRDLHIEKAIECIDFSGEPDIIQEEALPKDYKDNGIITRLLTEEFFSMDKISIKGKYEDNINQTFKVYSVTEGSGLMNFEGEKYFLNKGEVFFIPPKLKISFEGNIEILKVYL